MPSNYLTSGRVVLPQQAIPAVTVNGGAVSWRGQSMADLAVVSLLDGSVFSASGFGAFPLGSLVRGNKGTIDVQMTSGMDILVVAATGSITTVDGSLLVDGDTFTLDDGVNVATVFEFDDDATVTPGNVAVAFTAPDTVTTVRNTIVAAINGVGTLDITASPGAANQVLLVNDTAGIVGNVAITELVTDPGFVVSGMSGGVDAGPERTVLYLTDNLTTPTNYILLAVDSLDRPLLRVTNALGTLVAEVTPAYPPLIPGQSASIRLTWDSADLIPGQPRQASLRVNREMIPSGDWTTDPTSDWLPFQPSFLVLGQGLGASDFNGVLEVAQVSNAVIP